MTFSAIDRRRIRQRERESKEIERDDATIMATIMEHHSGRRWMYDKFVRGHIFSTCFSTDALQMAYNCGVQTEALIDFQKVVTLCPEEYLQMMKEAHERDKLERESARRRTRDPIDAARERGNADEAERLGIVSERDGDEADDGDDEDSRGGL